MNILTRIERMLGFNFPVPISDAKRAEDQKKAARRIVAGLSRGNISLQNGLFITEKDMEKLREDNQKHNFLS